MFLTEEEMVWMSPDSGEGGTGRVRGSLQTPRKVGGVEIENEGSLKE